jgi:hypothetical protein
MGIERRSTSRVAAIAMVVKVFTEGVIVPTANGMVPLTIIRRQEVTSIVNRLKYAIAVLARHIERFRIRTATLRWLAHRRLRSATSLGLTLSDGVLDVLAELAVAGASS